VSIRITPTPSFSLGNRKHNSNETTPSPQLPRTANDQPPRAGPGRAGQGRASTSHGVRSTLYMPRLTFIAFHVVRPTSHVVSPTPHEGRKERTNERDSRHHPSHVSRSQDSTHDPRPLSHIDHRTAAVPRPSHAPPFILHSSLCRQPSSAIVPSPTTTDPKSVSVRKRVSE